MALSLSIAREYGSGSILRDELVKRRNRLKRKEITVYIFKKLLGFIFMFEAIHRQLSPMSRILSHIYNFICIVIVR